MGSLRGQTTRNQFNSALKSFNEKRAHQLQEVFSPAGSAERISDINARELLSRPFEQTTVQARN